MTLLLGSGFIASAFAKEMAARNLNFIQVSRSGFDYTNFEKLVRFFWDRKFEFVINAAGYSGRPNVDACESNKPETFFGNVQLPITVSHACVAAVAGVHGVGIPFAHVSSGCIYNGPGPFTELDEPNFSFFRPPCSYYSGTKALAEDLLKPFKSCYIWRLRIPFDEFDNPKNYISKLLFYPKLLNATNSLSHRGDFVKACLDLWQKGAPYGTYNVTNPGSISTQEVVAMIRTSRKTLYRTFEFFKDDEEFYREAAVAPRSSCVLSVEKLLAAGVKIRPVQDALDDALQKWTSE